MTTPKRVLVTGAAGFLGKHLRAILRHKAYSVTGFDLCDAPEGAAADAWIQSSPGLNLSEVIARARPDVIVHAAFVNRKPSEWSDEDYLKASLSDNLSLFQGSVAANVPVLLIGSSAVYGAGVRGKFFGEGDRLRPVTLYGMAKTAQESLALYYEAAFGLKLMVARLFNLCGPGQALGMLLPEWVNRVSAIADGGDPLLTVRNRATVRDFVDVRDAAAALEMMICRFKPGEVINVASSVPVSLMEISDELTKLCPVAYQVVETHPELTVNDPLFHVGSHDRIKDLYGWSPRISWQKSLADIWWDVRNRAHPEDKRSQ